VNKKARQLFERLTNSRVFRVLPHGVDVFNDIARLLPHYRPEVIFDVGANVGQSTKQFLTWAPKSRIYCFEPVTLTFIELQRGFGRFNNVYCFQLALGATRGRGEMLLQGAPGRYSLVCSPKDTPVSGDTRTEEVDVGTVSEFCHTMEIVRISFLKIDTEGHDLEVLKGAAKVLDEQRIDFVKVEAGMNPANERHVPFTELKSYVEARGYWLFGIYDQKHERSGGRPHLRRANPVFVSEYVMRMNLAPPKYG
jgi:FkbM family methyltransferase